MSNFPASNSEINETGRIADNAHCVLVSGQGDLASVIASMFASRGAKVALTGTAENCISLADGEAKELIAQASEKLGGLSVLVNVCLPLPEYGIDFVTEYPDRLRSLCLAAAEVMVNTEGSPAIINHCALPAMYVGTKLEDYMSTLRGGVTGVTRTYARKFGKLGLRVTAVQSGLSELADDSWVSQTVKDVRVPVKDWVSLEEIANFIGFLAIDSTYTTGQTMIIDGGLTAGISGV